MSVKLRSFNLFNASVARRISYANVASTLALVVALGTGTAYAADTVRSKDIVDGQVKKPDLAADAVTGAKLATDSVGTAEVQNDSLTTADIAGADVSGATISFGPGWISDGHCVEFTLDVPAAQVGQAVVISVQGDLQDGMLIQGQGVLSDGVVRYELCNFTHVQMEPIDNLPLRVITLG